MRSGAAHGAHDDVVQRNDLATGGGERPGVVFGGDDLPPTRVSANGDIDEGEVLVKLAKQAVRSRGAVYAAS